jgi:general secretion pathway protein M
MSAARDWWNERSQRERTLLLVMFGLLALVLAWLLIVRPLGDALDAARTRHDAAVLALAEARARAGAAAPAARAAPAGPVDSIIARTGAEAGFANARIAAQGPQRATVVIEAARPQALFGWVARLEAQGVDVDTLQARANQDTTLHVEATFRATGRDSSQ